MQVVGPVSLLPAWFGLIAVGLFLVIIVAAAILSMSRAGKTAVAVLLLAPLLLFGSVCFLYLMRSEPAESATVVYSEGAVQPRPLIPLEAPAAQSADGPLPSTSSATPGAREQGAAPPSEIIRGLTPPARRNEELAPPIRKTTAGAGRPAWMDEPIGKRDGAYRTIVTAGPYATPQECNQKLNEAIHEAIQEYVKRYLAKYTGAEIHLPPAFIHERLARNEWLEQSEYSFGPMYNLHELLVFDDAVNQEIDRRYRESRISGRLAYSGAGAGLVLGLIATVFGYLKLDTATRGYYSGRLRVAAGAAILALATVAGLLAHGNIGF